MGIKQVSAQFEHVPEEYRAGLRYGLPLSWMGRNEDKAYLWEELERTLQDLKDKGFNVLETGGQGSGTDPDNGGFFSENWKRMFKKLLRRCNELGIHIQLTAVMDGQPMGYLEPDSDKCENYRPKRLYATEPVRGLTGMVTALTLTGESISKANTPVAVVAVRTEDGVMADSLLLNMRDFHCDVAKIPKSERKAADPNSARMKIELKGNEALQELDLSVVMKGIRGAVTDDGQPNPAPMSMPGGPPAPAADENPSREAPSGMPAGGPPGYEERAILDPATHTVTFTYTGPGLNLGEGCWDIIAYYQLPNPKESYVPGSGFFGMGDPGDNHRTIVNCFTVAGAEKVIDTYESHVFDDEMRELLRKNGAGLFYDGGDGDPRCDAVTWSEGLPEKFLEHTGYDLLPYLPVIYSGYHLPGDGEKRLAIEKLKVLSIMYGEFLARMSEWLETYHMGYHHQAAYSTHLETQEAMGRISVPEVESLNYADCVGGYIAATSAARLHGHRKVSCEMGATFRNPYDGRLRNLLTEINLALVSGVNQMKLHTSTFRYGENALWPGHNIHYASLPDFNDTQPFWLEMDQIGGAIDRGQLAVRRGTARRDVIEYLRRFQEPEGNTDDCHHLLRHGYTYDYYNAEMLSLLTAEDGVLDPAGGAFKAVIVEANHLCRDGRMPSRAAKDLLRFAKAGVPIIVQGALPEKTEGLHDSDETLRSLWAEIAVTGKLTQVEDKREIVPALRSLGIRPNVETEQESGMISWCSDADDVRCYFLLNQGRTYYRAYPQQADFYGLVRLKGKGGLYRVDLWTGETSAVPYTRDGDYAVFTLNLHSWEAAIFLLGGPEAPRSEHLPVFGKPVELTDWTLQIESWTPANDYGTSAETPEGTKTQKELLEPIRLPRLIPWKDIPGVDRSLSGVGYYRTTFRWDGANDGAMLELGRNYDTARVWVNGREAKLDQLGLRADISKLLIRGKNTLLVRTPTGLCNVLYSLGAIPCEQGYADFGLLGPVVLQPYRSA